MLGWLSTRCAAVRQDLVGWNDGGLTTRRARQVRAHLDRCRNCAAEAEALRVSIAAQREKLQSLMSCEGVDQEGAEIDRLWQQFERRARTAAPSAPREPVRWLWRPALAFAVASALLWLGSAAFDEPAAVLISVGVKAPPSKLTQHPDLFKDYAVIQDLDVLEHFDTAGADVPEDAATPAANDG